MVVAQFASGDRFAGTRPDGMTNGLIDEYPLLGGIRHLLLQSQLRLETNVARSTVRQSSTMGNANSRTSKTPPSFLPSKRLL